ncbi:hypothetical protein K439DRAFT_1616897 [Ramaria rubella]|nr:hypothetical protein K439DRAFT_1616897 [Ramaria rubella]
MDALSGACLCISDLEPNRGGVFIRILPIPMICALAVGTFIAEDELTLFTLGACEVVFSSSGGGVVEECFSSMVSSRDPSSLRLRVVAYTLSQYAFTWDLSGSGATLAYLNDMMNFGNRMCDLHDRRWLANGDSDSTDFYASNIHWSYRTISPRGFNGKETDLLCPSRDLDGLTQLLHNTKDSHRSGGCSLTGKQNMWPKLQGSQFALLVRLNVLGICEVMS